MADSIRTVCEFVAAGRAGDRRADAMVARAVGKWRQCVGCQRWYASEWHFCNLAVMYSPPPYATGTDGRRLAEVLDALGATFHVVATDHKHKAMAMALAAVRRRMEKYRCNLFIAACAALLVARGKLERS